MPQNNILFPWSCFNNFSKRILLKIKQTAEKLEKIFIAMGFSLLVLVMLINKDRS